MATHIPESPDALLTRDQAAAALTESGFPVAPKTLAVRVHPAVTDLPTNGSGPGRFISGTTCKPGPVHG
jgi:hypothetical protein